MDFWHSFDDDDDDPDWQENYNRGHSMGAVIILVISFVVSGRNGL